MKHLNWIKPQWARPDLEGERLFLQRLRLEADRFAKENTPRTLEAFFKRIKREKEK